MKKILFLILLIIPIISFSQKNLIEQNALKWFKSIYVQNYFKDPYSFKFVKIKSIPLTNMEYYKTEKIIPYLKKMGRKEEDATIYYTAFVDEAIKMYKEFSKTKSLTNNERDSYYDKMVEAENLRFNMGLVIHMNNEVRNDICRYAIYIDCYSNNSFGNKVLGKFAFYYYPSSSNNYSYTEKYSYKSFMIDEKSIVNLND